ncbi:MAG: hypothetical protein ACLFVP_04540 [Candidatus Bathyarchaeia archaeon]
MIIPIADYMFDGPYESIEELKDESGVFSVVCVDEGNWYLLDVDHAEEVRTALLSHPREEQWRKYKRGEIRYAVLYTGQSSREKRQMIEVTIRDEYKDIPCPPADPENKV